MANLQTLLDQFSSRLDLVEQTLGISGGSGAGGGSPAAAAAEDAPASITAYDAFSKPHLDAFVEACSQIGGPELTKCSELVQGAWAAQRTFLLTAAKCKKPSDQVRMEMLKPIADIIKETASLVKRDDFEHHYKTLQEGLSCMNWLMIEPSPRDWIEAQVGASDYSANKIRIKYKRNTEQFSPAQHQFCDAFKKLLSGLVPYSKEHHVAGVAWNPRGEDAASFSPPAAAAAAATPAAAPKAAAAPPKAAPKPAAAAAPDLKNALSGFSTSGLKKVTKDMQTWRSEFKGADGAAAPVPKKKTPAARPVVVKTKGTKMCEFKSDGQGKRWCVEAQTKDDGVVGVDVTDAKHSVNIYGCFQATIDVRGKCKGVTIDSCERTKVIVDTVLSVVELINCKRMHIEIRNSTPVVNIDKTDGCSTMLAPGNFATTFTTAKSSEMLVSFTDPKDGEIKEVPIPEQFTHELILEPTPKMTANISDLYAH